MPVRLPTLGARCRPEQKLPDFLDEYKEFAGLSVHWVIVGPSGQDRRPESGSVMRTYDHCAAAPSPWIKTIANTFFLTNIAYHPHNFEFRCGPGPARRLAKVAACCARDMHAQHARCVVRGA